MAQMMVLPGIPIALRVASSSRRSATERLSMLATNSAAITSVSSTMMMRMTTPAWFASSAMRIRSSALNTDSESRSSIRWRVTGGSVVATAIMLTMSPSEARCLSDSRWM